jgi:hypothetical protein
MCYFSIVNAQAFRLFTERRLKNGSLLYKKNILNYERITLFSILMVFFDKPMQRHNSQY